MSQPFEVGKTYLNRAGEYVVQAIEGDRMRIRYVDGRVLVTSVEIQARIWENIQLERGMARDEERRRQARDARLQMRKRTRQARTRPRFQGFQEEDFQSEARQIAWSSREELGKVLAYHLNQQPGGGFGYWIVPRESGIHVAREAFFERDNRDRIALFFVSAAESGLTYGFGVGKGRGEAKAESAWGRFLDALQNDKIRQAIRSAMETYDLSLDVYAMQEGFSQVGHVTVQEDGFLWQHETAEQETTRQMDWAALAEYVGTVAPGKRCAVYLRKKLAIREAVESGAGLSGKIAAVFLDLVPLYDASSGA
jgi:hypothetical protein